MAEVDTNQEKCESKKLNTRRLNGTIEWFNFNIGYGFIIPNDPQFANVFVHKSAFVLKAGTTLKSSVIEQRLLEFDIYEDEERKHAWNVTAIGGLLLTDPIFEVYLTQHGVERRRSFRYRNYNNLPVIVTTDDDEDIILPKRAFDRWSAGYRSFNIPQKRRASLNGEKSRSGLDENWRERKNAENGESLPIGGRNRRRSVSSVRRVNDERKRMLRDSTNSPLRSTDCVQSETDCVEIKQKNAADIEKENDN